MIVSKASSYLELVHDSFCLFLHVEVYFIQFYFFGQGVPTKTNAIFQKINGGGLNHSSSPSDLIGKRPCT